MLSDGLMSLARAETAAPPAFDKRAFRDALGRFVTGVTVVTARRPDGAPVGVTINSFTSVSLDPPLVLFCLALTARSLPVFRSAGAFAVSVLAEDQKDCSARFARLPDEWDGIETEIWDTGAPLLKGAVAGFDCVTHTIHDGGDHLILVGRVVRFAGAPGVAPLVYHQGRYARITGDSSG